MQAPGGSLAGTVLLFVLTVGCAAPQSRAEACRNGNSWNRVGRAANGKDNSTTNAVEDLHCDAVEANEQAAGRERRAEQRAQEASDEQARVERQGSDRRLSAELENIRRAPSVPEVGATVAEAQVLCTQQRGTFVSKPAGVGCRIRGLQLFACTMSDGQADRCDGYYEGADFAVTRRSVEAKLGPPTRESVSSDGFRVFEWSGGSETVVVTMYAKGVRMTHARGGATPTTSSEAP